MRKFVIALAAAGRGLSPFASPASAQYYPQPSPTVMAYNAMASGGYNGYGQVRRSRRGSTRQRRFGSPSIDATSRRRIRPTG